VVGFREREETTKKEKIKSRYLENLGSYHDAITWNHPSQIACEGNNPDELGTNKKKTGEKRV